MFNTYNNLRFSLAGHKLSTKLYVRGIARVGGDEFDDGFHVWGNFEFSAEYAEGMIEDQMKDEIRNELSVRCGCHHDCCGHLNGWGYPIRKIGERTWFVKMMYYKNY